MGRNAGSERQNSRQNSIAQFWKVPEHAEYYKKTHICESGEII